MISLAVSGTNCDSSLLMSIVMLAISDDVLMFRRLFWIWSIIEFRSSLNLLASMRAPFLPDVNTTPSSRTSYVGSTTASKPCSEAFSVIF